LVCSEKRGRDTTWVIEKQTFSHLHTNGGFISIVKRARLLMGQAKLQSFQRPNSGSGNTESGLMRGVFQRELGLRSGRKKTHMSIILTCNANHLARLREAVVCLGLFEGDLCNDTSGWSAAATDSQTLSGLHHKRAAASAPGQDICILFRTSVVPV
jgi:hypothetical protein